MVDQPSNCTAPQESKITSEIKSASDNLQVSAANQEKIYGDDKEEENYDSIKSCFSELHSMSKQFDVDSGSDTSTGFSAASGILSGIGPLRQRFDDAFLSLKSKPEAGIREIEDWLEDTKSKFLSLSLKLILSAVNYTKKVAREVGVDSFSLTLGAYDISATFNFNVK